MGTRYTLLFTSMAAVLLPLVALAQMTDSLTLLKAEADSGTGVLLTFSHELKTPEQPVNQMVAIVFGSGGKLAVLSQEVRGNTVLVKTEPQNGGTPYAVRVSAYVGFADDGSEFMMDNISEPKIFTGKQPVVAQASSKAASSKAMSSIPAMPIYAPSVPALGGAEVQNLTVTATAEGNNLYAVDVRWAAPATGNVTGYRVSQTTNGGNTYGAPAVLSSAVNGTVIRHVPAGTFGIAVQTVNANGTVSRGVTNFIKLGGAGGTTLPGTVTNPQNCAKDKNGKCIVPAGLTGAGPETLMLLALGAAAGWSFYSRRKSTPTNV